MEQCLEELGYAVVPIKGTSMWPLLKEGDSWVQVAARDGRQLKAGDVVYYTEKDNGNMFDFIFGGGMGSMGGMPGNMPSGMGGTGGRRK